MKIVQFITRMDTIGGAQIHVKDMSMGMKTLGHTIILVSGSRENMYKAMDKEGILYYQSKHLIRNLHVFKDIKAFFELRKILKRTRPDLIASHSSKAGIIGRLAGRSLGIPTVFTAHGWSFTEGVSKKKRVFYMGIEKLVGFISDGIITVSEYDRQLAKSKKIVASNKLHTIHNGVHELEHFTQSSEMNPSVTIIMVARFATPKKQLALLQALEKLQFIEWTLRFAGDGPLLQEAKDFVRKHGLQARVQFLGNRQDIAKLLRQSDLFVLLSDWEGLPLSILEAMRSGLPIIASDVGGVKEAVTDSVNGYLVPKNDEEELLHRLSHLLSDSSLRRDMGNESRRLFEEKFTFHKMLTKTDRLYSKVIQEKQEKLTFVKNDA